MEKLHSLFTKGYSRRRSTSNQKSSKGLVKILFVLSNRKYVRRVGKYCDKVYKTSLRFLNQRLKKSNLTISFSRLVKRTYQKLQIWSKIDHLINHNVRRLLSKSYYWSTVYLSYLMATTTILSLYKELTGDSWRSKFLK